MPMSRLEQLRTQLQALTDYAASRTHVDPMRDAYRDMRDRLQQMLDEDADREATALRNRQQRDAEWQARCDREGRDSLTGAKLR